MAASMDLATRAALKLYLSIDETDTSQDDLLDALIDYSSERIESHCARRFAEEDVTEYRDGSGTDRLVLSRRPVSELTAVYGDSDREFGEETKIPSAELALHPSMGLVVRPGSFFARGTRNLKIVYTAGYAIPPDDVAAACVKLAACWYAHARAGADGISRESLGDYSAEYRDRGLPADVEAMLAPYREPQVG